MKNSFTKEDIKNSVEYRWRKSSFKWFLITWVVIAVATLFATVIASLDNLEYIGISMQVWLVGTGVYSLFLLPFIVYYGYKMHYLMKNYQSFSSYVVTLDRIATAIMYRAVYYTVTIEDGDGTYQVDTNPYFSSGLAAPFQLEDYNNKRVIGLYDNSLDKFYIIKKVD